ncbi:hypothetical protein D3C76_1621930 [compost metagenome]
MQLVPGTANSQDGGGKRWRIRTVGEKPIDLKSVRCVVNVMHYFTILDIVAKR